MKSTGERGLSPGERQIAARQRFDGAIKAARSRAGGYPVARGLRRPRGLPEAEKGPRLAGAQRQAGCCGSRWNGRWRNSNRIKVRWKLARVRVFFQSLDSVSCVSNTALPLDQFVPA